MGPGKAALPGGGRQPPIHVRGPVRAEPLACERVLRSLPGWFGIEASLHGHVGRLARQPTFVAESQGELIGFMSLQPGPDRVWALDCLAVEARWRGQGVGRQLQASAEHWLAAKGGRVMQVLTLAESHPCPAYAQTRAFYEAVGYVCGDDLADGWSMHLPVVQMSKALSPA
jgi:GNAT superfamily N-acetyltransferase